MKTLLLLTSLMSTSLMAKTIVKIPLFVELNNKQVSTAEINKKYKLQGEDKLVEVLIVDNTAKSAEAARNTYWAQNEKVDQISEKLGVSFYLDLGTPGNNDCYLGNPAEAVSILGGLADGPFSDQLGFWGWKYKNETHFEDSYDSEESNNALNEGSKIWKNWKGYDDSILLVSHISDSGDDMIEAVIKTCK